MIQKRLVEDFFSRERKFEGVERELKVTDADKIISIVGPRRAGKTWFFYYLLGKVAAGCYINFEDIAFRNIKLEEVFDVLKIFSEIRYKPKTLLLDEIQVLEGWQTLARSLYDRGYKVFITGSSSKLLPREISTQLRGRTLSYVLLPFSFREIIKAKKLKFDPHIFEDRGVVLRALRDYLTYGGFPEVVLSKDRDRITRQYFEEIFYRDFVERHKLKSLEFGRFLFEFAFQNYSKEISFRKIKNFFNARISDTTLYSYVEKLQDTMAVFFLEKFSPSVYLRRSWPRKIYVCDTGISRMLDLSEDIGRKMENVVFLNLLRRTNQDPLLRVYYWKSVRGEEVDFVIKRGAAIDELIQVTYTSGRDEIEKREIKSLIKASNELKCKDLSLITWDYEDELEIDGKTIKCIPLWKWLLSIDSRDVGAGADM